MHILIVGDQGMGKTTLINKLLPRERQPIFGFITEKIDDTPGHSSVYMHPSVGERVYSEKNTIGVCSNRGAEGDIGAFNNLGVRLLTDIPAQSIVLMDELGFMETGALDFCSKVISIMDGSYFVIAAVKTKDTEFLNSVRSHKNALIYKINLSNRSLLQEQIIRDLRQYDPKSPFLA